MRKQKYMPYFFDYKYERKTYKYIGKDYGDYTTADKGWIRNITRWYRKRIYNRNELKYKFCNTYEEWKTYFLERQPNNSSDYQNMIKYLIQKKRTGQMILDVSKTLVIPIYIALFSVLMSLADGQSAIQIILLMVIIIIVSAYLIYKGTRDLCFYNDCIKCLESNWEYVNNKKSSVYSDMDDLN